VGIGPGLKTGGLLVLKVQQTETRSTGFKSNQIKSKVVYCSPNLQNEFAVHVQSSDKRGNPKERTVPLAGSPSFTISLRCITNKVVFVNTYLKKQYQNQWKGNR